MSFGFGRRDPAAGTLLLILAALGPLACDAAQTPGSRASAGRAAAGDASPVPPAALIEEIRSLKAELAVLKEGKVKADQALETSNGELRRLTTELLAIRQASANVLQIQTERDNLQENVIHLERELETIKRAKLATDEDHRQAWFLIGAGVLLSGLVLGLILPQLSWRKRSGWDSF